VLPYTSGEAAASRSLRLSSGPGLSAIVLLTVVSSECSIAERKPVTGEQPGLESGSVVRFVVTDALTSSVDAGRRTPRQLVAWLEVEDRISAALRAPTALARGGPRRVEGLME
jgi:hypothetical protein